MPKFNDFIKGFEEKAEAEEPKENRDQIIEKVNQKMMNANTYGAFGDKENYEKSIAEAEELRKGLAPKADSTDYPYDEKVLEGITRDTPEKAKKLAQALYAYRVTKDTDLAGKLFDEYLSK